jgi:SAM-dependent methyltransferase
MNELARSSGGLVIDLGCGDKPYEPLIRDCGFGYIACDIEGTVDALIEPGSPVALPTGSALGVVSFQVLEHVWDLDWYLGEARRLLRSDGWLLLSTHGAWLYHPHPTDFRRWTRDGLRKELETRRFRIEWIDGLIGPLAWTTQIRALGMRHAAAQLPFGDVLFLPVMALLNLRMMLEDAITPAQLVERDACIYVALCRPD